MCYEARSVESCRRWFVHSLMVGLDESGKAALEQWGTGRVSTWREPSSLLDEHYGNCIGQLFEPFFLKFQQEACLDAISHVVYWFARAYTNNVGPGFDGPEAFTYIRNRLTHPPKVSAPKQQLPCYEAYCLAQWYVELTILAACGYTGDYGNRTIMRRWKGQVEKVPWA